MEITLGTLQPVNSRTPQRFLKAGGILLSALCLMGTREPLPGDIMIQEGIAYRSEGKKLQASGDLRGAAAAYQRAVTVFPAYAEAFNDLGVVLESLEDRARAQQAYETALKLKPSMATAHTNLALLHEEAGRIKEASEHWVARIRMGPPEDAWVLRARERLRKYNLPVPESQEELVQKRRDEVKLAIEGGRAHMEAGRYEAAVKEFERARALDPGNLQAGRLLSAAQSKAKLAGVKQMKQDQLSQARMLKEVERARKEELALKAEAERKAKLEKRVEPVKKAAPARLPVPAPSELERLTREMEAAKKAAQKETGKEARKEVVVQVKKPAAAPAPVSTTALPVLPAPKPPADALAAAREFAKEKSQFRGRTTQELYRRGAAAMREGRYPDAADAYRQILILHPDERDAKLALERAEKALAVSSREAERF